MMNAMQGKSMAYQSFITSHICIKHKTEKFVTALHYIAQVVVLIGQDYEVTLTLQM